MYLFWPHWYKNRNQIQEENWKIHKYVEIKKHISEQSMSKRRNQKRKQKVLKQMKMETQHRTELMICYKSSSMKDLFNDKCLN